jgi:hypothetical protein
MERGSTFGYATGITEPPLASGLGSEFDFSLITEGPIESVNLAAGIPGSQLRGDAESQRKDFILFSSECGVQRLSFLD